jgi:DNA repair and recombination protein RadB
VKSSNKEWISTACIDLDIMLGGGIRRGDVTLIYGAAKTGKTTIALQCSVAATKQQIKTIYLDCQNSFSIERFSQIASSDIKAISSLIYVFKLHSFNEQTRLIENLDKYLSDKTELIIIDTITSLYRLELQTAARIFQANRVLNRQLAYLNHIAKARNAAVLITSQVHDMINDKPVLIEPVAMRVLYYWAQNILKITIGDTTQTRRILLEKSSKNTVTKKMAECQIELKMLGMGRDS